MYNIIISVAISALVTGIALFFSSAWWGALLLFVAVFAVTFVALSKMIMNKVVASLEIAGKDLQGQRFEKAIRELKETLDKYSKWQIYVDGQINSQIGMIYYMKRDFSNAFPYLQKSFSKNWAALGMLAISYMKRQKKDKMIETFDKAVQWSQKEPLLWNLYAYCLVDCGEKQKAKDVLAKGLKKNPSDQNLKDNLENIEAGKPMKMRQYGEQWFQFHLEPLAALQKYQMQQQMGGGMKKKMMASSRR